MGTNSESSAEKPVHFVTFSKGFYLDKYEVTQTQWESVMGSNPSVNNKAAVIVPLMVFRGMMPRSLSGR